MYSRPLSLLVLLFALPACSTEPNDPAFRALVGEWGEAGAAPAQLTGLHGAAELRLLCGFMTSDDPIILREDNTFMLRGVVGPSSARLETVHAVLHGTVRGDTITATLALAGRWATQPPTIHRLVRNTDPLFERHDLPVCVL